MRLNIQTVLGSINPDNLGITLMHEHIFADSRFRLVQREKIPSHLENSLVSITNLGLVHKDPFASKDNLVLEDENVAIEELLHFKKYDGASIVELSTPGFGRNPLGNCEVSKKTGINIIIATGWYTGESHPLELKKKSVDDLKEIMIAELSYGIENTGIRAGVIKCANANATFHEQEAKVFRAASQTQSETQAGLTLHPYLDRDNNSPLTAVDNYLKIYEREGGNVEKFVLSHCQSLIRDKARYFKIYEQLLERGITLCFEFGLRRYQPAHGVQSLLDSGVKELATELERIKTVYELCSLGYDKQILLSQDVFLKIHLKRFGGFGYSHVFETIIPILKDGGVSSKQIRNVMIENPKRILQK